MIEYGPWKIIETQQVYKDAFIDLKKDDVIRPDGNPGSHVKVWMKPGVSILAMDSDQNVYLTSEFHYAIGRDSIELVSGGIDAGETAEETAARELKEELGIEAGSWARLGSVDPFTTIINSPTELFLATDLKFGQPQQEATEVIECVKMPLSEAIEKVMTGVITHGPSCIAILKTARQNSVVSD